MKQIMQYPSHCCPVTFGDITFYLTDYKIVGIRAVSEAGTTSGVAVVTGSWQKGTRVTLTGKLSPEISVSAAAAALASDLRGGWTQDIMVEDLMLPSAVLCQYSLQTADGGTAVTLILYTAKLPVKKEVTA